MRSNNLKHVGPQRRKSKAPQAAQQQTGPSIASNSSNASLACSDENNDPASSSDGADSKYINAAPAAIAFPGTHKSDVAMFTCPSRSAKTCKYGSDSDISDEYTPSQHASRSSRYTARLQKQGVTPSSADCETALPAAAVRFRTTSLHSSTEAPLLAGPASGRHSSQALPLLASHRFAVPQRPFTGDPRLESMVQDRFAAVASSKVSHKLSSEGSVHAGSHLPSIASADTPLTSKFLGWCCEVWGSLSLFCTLLNWQPDSTATSLSSGCGYMAVSVASI